MSSETTEVHHAEGGHGDTMTRKKIWNVFFVLLGITTIEFFIALYLVPNGHMAIKDTWILMLQTLYTLF